MRLLAGISALLLAGLVQAHATGTLVCEAEDKTLSFFGQAVLGGLRHGIMQFTGKLDLRVPTLPPELRTLTLTPDDLSQRWLDGKELRLEIYHERGDAPNGYVLLLIATRKISEDNYRGRYVLTTDVVDKDNAFGTTPNVVRGKAKCETG